MKNMAKTSRIANRPSRLVMILQLFDRDRPVWTVEQMARALGLSSSTIYRHVRNLVKGGFLDPVSGAAYALGPAFVRFDQILRHTDPLSQIAAPVMQELLERTSEACVVIVCRKFKDCVMCVQEARGSKFRGQIGYERGVTMPLFIGATSKVILAQLPDRQLKSVYLDNGEIIHRVLRASNWHEFRAQIKDIREAGYALTRGEVAANRVGLAVPIARNGKAFASISLVGTGKMWDDKKKVEAFIRHVRAAAAQISRALARQSPVVSR
jgi:DNA-binding IclR family transcriptional regulator